MSMTATRLAFVKIAAAKFGDGATISKKQIDQIAAEAKMPSPQWLYNSTTYRTNQRGMYKLPNLGEFMPVVGHSLPMDGNVPSQAILPVVEPEIAKTDDELLQEINNSFTTLEIMAESVKNGTTTSLIVAGPAGVGKSHTIEAVLGDDESKTHYIHGKIKATGLYKYMYQYRDKGQTIIIDDSDEIFSEEVALNILKNGLDSKENRHISWGSEYILVDDEGTELPKSFTYRGSIIFITNINFYQEIEKANKQSKHLKALLSRSHYMDIDLYSTRKLFLHTLNVLYSGGMLDKMGLFEDEQEQLVQYIEQNLDKLREITPRAAKLMAQHVLIGRSRKIDWRILSNQMCLK